MSKKNKGIEYMIYGGAVSFVSIIILIFYASRKITPTIDTFVIELSKGVLIFILFLVSTSMVIGYNLGKKVKG